GAAHDSREVLQRWICNTVNSQERIEGAAIAFVRKLDAGHVVWCGPGFTCNRHNAIRGHVDKARRRINEAANQPWTGNAIDLWPLTRHPLRRVMFLAVALASHRQLLVNPC